MQEKLIATGYTTVVMVVNLKRFVVPEFENERLFDSIRGTKSLVYTMRNDLPRLLQDNELFEEIHEYRENQSVRQHMPADETGFVTGIFRHNMVKDYSAPSYKLNKDKIHFPELLRNNFQFRRLFLPIWRKWDIYIRPTMTGMFVVRLVRHYQNAASAIQLSKDVIDLQTSFDIQGALEQFAKIEEEFAHEPDTIAQRKESVQLLLDWLGIKDQRAPRLSYVPVQWQLAMAVCGYFVDAIGSEIRVRDNGGDVVRLQNHSNRTPNQLHDYFTIFHIDQLMTRLEKGTFKPMQTARHVQLGELTQEHEFKEEVVNLLEGAMLLRQQTEADQSDASRRYFPTHSPDYVNGYFERCMNTWDQELCLMTARSAFIMPSRKDRQADLYVSTLPATPTTSVSYLNYWDALERMIEFVSEVRVLAQIVERASASLLQNYVRKLRYMREDLLSGVLQVDSNELIEIVEQSANLNRLLGLCQSLSNPHVWSRAEYGADKADHLVEEMRISLLLQHAERNVNSLTNLVNHTDELYLAELSERNNQRTTLLTLVLGVVSFSVILFSLPSFWADVDSLNDDVVGNFITNTVLPFVTDVGNIVGLILLPISFIMAIAAIGYALLLLLRRVTSQIRSRAFRRWQQK